MRIRSSLLLLPLALVSLPLTQACGSSEEEVDAANLTDDDLAKQSLTLMGNKALLPAGDTGACNACHDIGSKPNLTKWKDSYAATVKYWDEPGHTQMDRINFLRKDPSNPQSPFAPAKAGVMAAGVHLGTSAQVVQARHPLAYAQGKRLAELFKGQDELYRQFRSDMLMPIESPYPRLTASEYEVVLTWMQKGLPKIDSYISSGGQPTSCTDNFAGLKAHASAVKSANWMTQNRDAAMPMFACVNSDAIECFKQQVNGKDAFPIAETTTYGKGWSLEGSSVRILRALDYTTYYWMRSSADGRFVANGGGPQGKAVIADLQPGLTGGKRDINVEARYDPDFYPDNKSFMFQGTSIQGAICAQSLLLDPAVTNITFRESKCNAVGGGVSLYQTIGQRLGDNEISDHFIVNNGFTSDNWSGGERADREVTASKDSSIKIHVMVARGNDAEAGYEKKQTVEVVSPYLGDTMMARSGDLVGSRISGPNGVQLGYSLDKLSFTKDASGYKFAPLQNAGKICMGGNKANISFDERFLTTHHYTTKTEYPSSAYNGKGSADIYVADFVTGKKTKITQMGPGQFALFPHFRSDGWLYFIVRDASGSSVKEYVVASDYAVRAVKTTPTP